MRLVVIARAAAQVRMPVIALAVARILGVIPRILAPSVQHGNTLLSQTANDLSW